jgi:polar amino acid transport system permease protein
MDVDLILKVWIFFAKAAVVTVEISALSCVLGLVLGFVAALGKLSPNRAYRYPATAYVSAFRGTPCLIQLFIIYFGGPQIGLDLEPFAAGVLGLGLNIGAYMTESIRGAIVAVDEGQWDAARSLGLKYLPTIRKVILPQAARLMIRPLGINTVALIKGSALVSAISVVELTYTAHRFISSTYKPFEMFTLSAFFYLLIISVVSRAVNVLDRRYALGAKA